MRIVRQLYCAMEVLKYFLLFCVIFVSVSCQSCPNMFCTSSTACEERGGAGCRCIALECQFNSFPCSGGCLTDRQCVEWSGNSRCECRWLVCSTPPWGRDDANEIVDDDVLSMRLRDMEERMSRLKQSNRSRHLELLAGILEEDPKAQEKYPKLFE